MLDFVLAVGIAGFVMLNLVLTALWIAKTPAEKA